HMGDIYPELRERLSFTQEIALKEEERFLSTLENGERRLRTMLVDKKELTGEELFSLHDTYGFPLELVEEMVEGTGVKLDREGNEAAVERQRERGREAIGDREYLGNVQVYTELFDKTGNSVFSGYRTMRDRSTVMGLVKEGIEVD